MLSAKRRVVVTGLGLLTPLGFNAAENWTNISNSKSAISPLKSDAFKDFPCRIAGQIDQDALHEKISSKNLLKKADIKNMSLANVYAIVAASEALEDAKWTPKSEIDSYRAGTSIATGIAGISEIADAALALNSPKGYRLISPYFVPKILPNLSSGLISIKYNLKGPAATVTTACAAGAHAINDAFNFIRHGVVDLMVCGATEGCIHPISIAGFSRMRALATDFNDKPELASRPFDKDRNGFVMSEGAGCLVLESLEHALERKANIYAEILGVAATADANHITNPSSEGDGAFRCMKNALKDANVKPEELNYINCHATSTPAGDIAEIKAIERLFGDQKLEHKVYVSSLKGSIGHLLGAAGSVELILTILSQKNKTLLPTLNLQNLDPKLGLDKYPFLQLIQNENIKIEESTKRFISLKNSFGFGGTNGSICVSNFIL